MSQVQYVISLSGVSGSGKSSLVHAVSAGLQAASCFYFDDYGPQMTQPESGAEWIAKGSNLAEFVLPALGSDLRRIKSGETIVTPAGRTVGPASVLVIEEPFGRGRADMGDQIDLSVCIDIPLEIALARRLLDVTDRWDGTADSRLDWISGYLKCYLFEDMRNVYIAINEREKNQADLIIDGLESVESNAARIIEIARVRLAATGR